MRRLLAHVQARARAPPDIASAVTKLAVPQERCERPVTKRPILRSIWPTKRNGAVIAPMTAGYSLLLSGRFYREGTLPLDRGTHVRVEHTFPWSPASSSRASNFGLRCGS